MEIRIQLAELGDAVILLVQDLDPADSVDKQRIADVEYDYEKQQEEVLKNEKEVRAKVIWLSSCNAHEYFRLKTNRALSTRKHLEELKVRMTTSFKIRRSRLQ